MKKQQIILVVFAFVAFVGIMLCFLPQSKTLAQWAVRFQLPSSTIVQKSKLSLFDGNVYIKAIFSSDDLTQMISSLENYYDNYDYVVLQRNDIIPNFVLVCPWWDMNVDNIVVAYHAFTSGKLAKTKELYSFVVIDSSDNYLLYVAH